MSKKKPTVKTKEERSKYKLERDLADLRFVAKYPEGRRLLWRFLSEQQIFQPNLNAEVFFTGFVEGRRAAGLSILHDIFSAKASLFGQMQEEHASELKRELLEIEQEEEQSDPLSLD